MKQLKFLFIVNVFALISCSGNSSKEIETREEGTEKLVDDKMEKDSIVRDNLNVTDTVKNERKNENPSKRIQENLPYTGIIYVSPKKCQVGSYAWKKAVTRDSSIRVIIERNIAIHGNEWAENNFDPNIKRVYNEYIKK